MMRAFGVVGLLAFVVAGGAVAQAPPDELVDLQAALYQAIERVAGAVVTIETFGGARRSLVAGDEPEPLPDPKPLPGDPKPDPDKKDDEGEKKLGPLVQPGFLQAQGATTGIVLSADGWILVSRFALNFDPTTILVTLPDGRSFNARRAGEDTSRGIALVKIDASELPVPTFVAPSDVSVGQWAFALGRTFGRQEPSVHMGIVSARDRLFGRALQTDAYTSPANYGGPVIDLSGRVLGVSVPLSRSGRDAGAELYDSGIGFATTIANIGPLLERMKEGAVLHRGWLGISTAVDDLGPGARLTGVQPQSPAADSGLRPGDLIAAVDGVSVRNSYHVEMLVSSKMGGEPVFLVLIGADGKRRTATVTLGDLPESERKAKKPAEEAGVLPWEEGEKGEKKDGGR